ncbi:MAG: zf-HC2 domain-containing protein [Gemmatimonadaceae bacterium]
MNDCQNVEIRDRLPDLMHGRLAPERRAEVEAHVASCADCRAELKLLTSVRDTFGAGAPAGSPAIDRARIVTAVVSAQRAGPAVVLQHRRLGWRGVAAAAAVIVAVGVGSAIVTSGGERGWGSSAGDGSTVAVAAADESAGPAVDAGLTPGALSELTEADLRLLLASIDDMDALPAVEPRDVIPDVAELPDLPDVGEET